VSKPRTKSYLTPGDKQLVLEVIAELTSIEANAARFLGVGLREFAEKQDSLPSQRLARMVDGLSEE
jgi:hypothetical protein